MTLRICILETDNIHPDLVEQFEGYGRMFQRLFARQPIAAQLEIFNVVAGRYPDDQQHYDAYLVTGSKADSFANDPWIATLRVFLLKRYQLGDKLMGVCFGHQLLALLLGGKAERATQGWGVGVHHYAVSEQPEWLQPSAERLAMLISHQDQVTLAPENATVLAGSEFCPIGAYYIGDQVLCFQGHPEFDERYSRSLLELRQKTYGEEVYQRGIGSLQHEQQGDLVAEWMMRFVAHAKH
jgi:GMP synthase-like glutamine amidotransferase